jgi:hypothetical protein
MAFASGKKSTTSTEFNRYTGMAPCKILAVNPDKAKMEELFGSTLEKEPEYTGTQESNGKTVKTARVSFVVQPIVEDLDVSPITINFFISEEYMVSQAGKYKVIDKYGRTAWVTKEQAKNHEIPVYSNGMAANIDKDYKPCYKGQEELVTFLRDFLGIYSPMRYNSIEKSWYMVPNPEECEGALDHVDKYFKGDFSEVKELVNLQPENVVSIWFGVRVTDDGKQYQSFLKEAFVKGYNTKKYYTGITKVLNERKQAGAYATTEFGKPELFEVFRLKVTQFKEQDASEELPFTTNSTTDNSDFPW